MTQEITGNGFDDAVLNSSRPVLVDFYANWCGPCKAIAPALTQLAEEFDGRVDVVKLDVDENPERAAQYGVRGLPTLALFENGKVVETITGAQPKTAIAELLSRHGHSLN